MASNGEIKDYAATIFVDGESVPILPETGHIAMRESMDFFVPSASIQFRDHFASFVSLYPMLQDTTIGITLENDENLIHHNFLAFSDIKKQDPGSATDIYDFKLDVISKYCTPLMTDGEFHSMKGKASDYVQYIADKLEIDSDIEETNDVRNWVNPNWKYSQMLRYLATRSVSVKGSSGYVYFINRDGVLVYKSIDTLFDENSDNDEEIVANIDQGITERDFTIRNNHFATVILGSNNLKARYYDYGTSSYIEEDVTYDKMAKKRGIKEGISQKYANTGSTKYFGEYRVEDSLRPRDIANSIFKRSLLRAESNQINLLTSVNLDRKVGGTVNLTIPTRAELETGGINLNYSGRYLIKGIVTMGHGDYFQKLQLIRPGINLDDNRTGYF